MGLTKAELTIIDKRIEEEVKAVQDSLPYLDQESQAIEPSSALGRLTRMEAISDKSVNEAILRQAKLKLEKLHNARKRIDAGTYGTCIRCKNVIPFGRLQAVPEALLCVPCAEKPRT